VAKIKTPGFAKAGEVYEVEVEEANMSNLTNKRVAILATNGFEQSELTGPRDALKQAGLKVDIVSLAPGAIRGWQKKDWGDTVDVDVTIDEAKVENYCALVLPGGQINPDILRTDERAVRFVRQFFDAKKPIGAICHGPWMLVEADVVRGRTVTSWPSVKTDLKNAGAKWVDQEVVVDQGLVTSRKPDDIPAFSSKLIEEISEGKHEERAAA
jgi:protease I